MNVPRSVYDEEKRVDAPKPDTEVVGITDWLAELISDKEAADQTGNLVITVDETSFIYVDVEAQGLFHITVSRVKL